MVKDLIHTKALEQAHKHSLEYLEGLESSSVAATASLEELRSRICKPLSKNGMSPERVIDELAEDVKGGLTGSAGGRFFGWVIGGSLPSALAADWLTAAWDQNAALYACSPAAAVIEEACGKWLKEILRLPEQASFALVTGCQMAHVTCLAAARYAVLAKHNWDVERKGLIGAPEINILSNSQRHGTIERALRLLGFGTECIYDIPPDVNGSLDQAILKEKLEEINGKPVILFLQAGDVNTGVSDRFKEIIPIAHNYNAWVHVDGAFGLWAAASPKFRFLVEGVESADSWTTDGHKWLNVPYDCGYAFVADRSSHKSTMAYRASYLTHDDNARDQIDWNPEWSRRARGVATYAAIRELGTNGIAQLVERCCIYAHKLVNMIGNLNGAEIICEPVINQGMVRFNTQLPGSTEADNDIFTDRVMAEILKTGKAFFGGTTWMGKRCMRISVSNWQTNDEDVIIAAEAVKDVLDKLYK